MSGIQPKNKSMWVRLKADNIILKVDLKVDSWDLQMVPKPTIRLRERTYNGGPRGQLARARKVQRGVTLGRGASLWWYSIFIRVHQLH